jgi:uncharacterized surface protein with fasciclin (FAS1) repeats
MRKAILIILLLLSGLLVLPSAAQEAAEEAAANQAYIRLAHFSPQTAGVNVYLDEQPTDFQNVEYQTVSDWIAIPAGAHTISLVPSADSTGESGIAPVDVSLEPDSWTTLMATGSVENGTFAIEAVDETFGEMLPGTAYYTFVNAVDGGANIDFIRNDVTYVPNLFPSGTEDVNWFSILDDADIYTFRAVDNQNPDTVLAEAADTDLRENESHLIALVGSANGGDVELVIDSTTMAEMAMLRGELQEPGTVIDALRSDERFTPIADAIDSAGLTETLNGEGPYTLFVPADFVMDDIPQAILSDPATLADFLRYHVVEGDLRSQDVLKAGTLTTLNGGQLTIEERGEDGFVNDAQIIAVNIPATNGTIHIINQPLMPDGMAASG